MESLTDDDILRKAKADYKASDDHFGEWREEAREDFGFVSGSGQWSVDDINKLKEQSRPVITFNRVGPVVDVVCGVEVSNRQEVRFIPRKLGDTGVNELLTSAAHWVMEQCNAEDEESDAFRDMVICGMGWTETRLDYETDPDGEILVERVDPLEMWPDPAAKKRNLVDARFAIRVRDIAKTDFDAMWPEHRDLVTDTAEIWSYGDEIDNALRDAPTPATAYDGRTGKNQVQSGGKVRVLHYQWVEKVNIYRVMNPLTGAEEFVDEETFEAARERLEALGAKFVKQTKALRLQAFIAGSTVLEKGEAPCPTHFSFQCMTGKRDRATRTWYGIVRGMKDPQRWANKWLSQVLFIINSNAKGGIMAETGAFDNVRKAQDEWAQPDAITWVKDGALQQSKILPKPPITYPAGLDQLMQFAIGSIRDVSGVNVEMLGMADRDQPGILEYQRKQAGINILAGLFDSLRLYRKEEGRILLYYIREYLSDGRLIRVVGDDGAKYIPLVRDPNTYIYDVIVDEAPTSPNMKEKVFAVLSQLLPTLLGQGVPMPPEVLDYSPLPEALATKWKEMLRPKEPKPPSAAEALMLEKLKADVEKTKAEVEETQADTQQKQSAAMLNVAKAGATQADVLASIAARLFEVPASPTENPMPMGGAIGPGGPPMPMPPAEFIPSPPMGGPPQMM